MDARADETVFKRDAYAGDGEAHVDEVVIPTDLPEVRRRTVVVAAVIVVLAFAAIFAIGWLPRKQRMAALNEDLAAQSVTPIVNVAQPARKNKPFDLVLPADVRSMQDTLIYPRASGYLKRLLVDIGDRVKAGQLLAEIDAPEIDAELRETQANLVLAQANLKKSKDDADLARKTLTRYEDAPPGGVTQQDLDEKRAALQQAEAQIEANEASITATQATVERLKAQTNFQSVVAPFGGTITARNFDVGGLLMPTSTPGAKELFRVEETDTLRVFVNVPQSYANSVKIGQQVGVSVRNFPGREFPGTVTRTTGSLDPVARTLRYQVDVPNKDGALYPGMYGQARIPITAEQPPIMVPTSALVFDAAGTRLWVVGPDDSVHARNVEVGRDYGTEVEIATGLTGDESVVTNPGMRLADGAAVTVARPAQANNTPAPSPTVAANPLTVTR